jgi:adenylate kinase
MTTRRTLLAWAAFSICALAAQAPNKSFVIVLIGPTGSGKTTQVEFIKRKYGIATINADDLVAKNPQALKKYETPGIDPGTPTTSDALNDLVAARLAKMNLKKGFALDGYPATKEQADYLNTLVKKFKLPAPIIIQLEVPDNIVRQRLNKRHRADDTPELIERRLKDYHRELDLVKSYYPEANIWSIDGTRPIAEVSSTIQSILNDELPKKTPRPSKVNPARR